MVSVITYPAAQGAVVTGAPRSNKRVLSGLVGCALGAAMCFCTIAAVGHDDERVARG